MTITKKRSLYVVCLSGDKDGPGWKVTCNGEMRALLVTQKDAIDAAVTACRSRWKNFGDLSELKIMGRNGKIRDSRTYGNDPREVQG